LRGSILAVSVILAWLTYRLVETPIRHGDRLSTKAALLAGIMAVVAGLGFYTMRASGFPARFPGLINQISDFKYDPAPSTRLGTYFLMGDKDETNFKKDPNEILPGRPTMYLWGDSHAAVLYPGVKSAYGDKFNIVQRTFAKTPPFMPDYFNPGGARRVNQFIFDSIVRDRPEVVLLEADWQEYDWPQVERTINALKAVGIRHIVLIGPVPQWNGSLPQQLFNYMRRHRNAPVPVRMTEGVDPRPAAVDRLMSLLGERLGIEYISPCKILGNQDGYLIRIGDTPDSLMTYDSSHLTANCSIFLVSHFPKF
jgi:hypothetical protein